MANDKFPCTRCKSNKGLYVMCRRGWLTVRSKMACVGMHLEDLNGATEITRLKEQRARLVGVIERSLWLNENTIEDRCVRQCEHVKAARAIIAECQGEE